MPARNGHKRHSVDTERRGDSGDTSETSGLVKIVPIKDEAQTVVQHRLTWAFNPPASEAAASEARVEPPPQHSMVVPAHVPPHPESEHATVSASEALIEVMARLGVTHGFGVFGGGIAPFCEAVSRSPVRIIHCRHETGAAFAAIESSLASQRLTLVMATTGPGLTNLYTGMVAARSEGAKVIFISGSTAAAQRGRGAFQETSHYSTALPSLYTTGHLFHQAAVIDDVAELPTIISRLISGASRPNGFVAHLGLPVSIQTARVPIPNHVPLITGYPAACDDATLDTCIDMLAQEPFVIWVGFGARDAAQAVRALAARSGSPVMCSPRAKGIFPEDSPQFLGVTGLGGHSEVEAYLRDNPPKRALVLGTRLGEFSSFWSPDLVPSGGFIHVDLDPEAFGTAYPSVPTFGVQAEIGAFLKALLAKWPERSTSVYKKSHPVLQPRTARSFGPVRPSYLMDVIQNEIVDRSDCIVLTEAGNSFTLGSHYLRFRSPGRYRVSTSFGSMGQAAAGVIGAALGSGRKAVAIVGDGSMLMLNEINTAANYNIDAVWIILNDARYGMIAQGMQSIGWKPFETNFPRSDFVTIARAMGADGIRVEHESDVEGALQRALEAKGPFVVDVIIDPREAAPANRRNKSLVEQGVNAGSKSNAGGQR